MTRRLFGTDGVRGRANTEPMTAATALGLGMAAGQVFTRGAHRHTVVIGKDTRLSGYMIEPALTSGFVSMGMNVILVGPLPTPAIGMLTRSLRADLGVMISASGEAVGVTFSERMSVPVALSRSRTSRVMEVVSIRSHTLAESS